MRRFITSDLHLGHRSMTKWRHFDDMTAHDDAIMASLADIPKRSKLWVLGDIAFDEQALFLLKAVKSSVKVAILGNHDHFHARTYLEVFDDIQGPIKYHGYWLSHHPIHPQELWRTKGNIHGHIHKDAATKPLPMPYYNVNWDFHRGPVEFEKIDEAFSQYTITEESRKAARRVDEEFREHLVLQNAIFMR